jgi:serine/threonine-protein kinase RsbW
MPSRAILDTTHVVIPSNPHAVRDALSTLFQALTMGQMPQDAMDNAQIVLAEALNNIVEHAYAQHPGDIEVTLHLSAQGMECRIVDTGLPMPGGGPPLGQSSPSLQVDDLPEGGFGWHLIRSLSQDLDYRRDGPRNLLTFRIEAQQSAH